MCIGTRQPRAGAVLHPRHGRRNADRRQHFEGASCIVAPGSSDNGRVVRGVRCADFRQERGRQLLLHSGILPALTDWGPFTIFRKGKWPVGAVEEIWSLVAVRRWSLAPPMSSMPADGIPAHPNARAHETPLSRPARFSEATRNRDARRHRSPASGTRLKRQTGIVQFVVDALPVKAGSLAGASATAMNWKLPVTPVGRAALKRSGPGERISPSQVSLPWPDLLWDSRQ